MNLCTQSSAGVVLLLTLLFRNGHAGGAEAPPAAEGADWPTFRGPGGRGVSTGQALPEKWSASEGIEWQVDLEGWGNSSPAVAGDRIYLTSQTADDRLHLVAIDRERGRLAWTREVAKGRLKAHDLHNMATPTPAAERGRVCVLFGTGDLASYDREGNLLWKRDLTREHGSYRILWGMGSSPMLHRGLLYLVCMHAGPSYVLALEADSGKVAWKKPRDLPCQGEATDSYSSAVLLEEPGRHELIVGGADHLTAYDPATGGQLWISSGLKIDHSYGRTIASPGAGEGVVVACSASVQGLGKAIAVRPGGQGDVTSTHRLWSYEKFTPDCPTPLCYQGRVYLVRDDGVASCLEASTGQLLWKTRTGGNTKASPVAGDGKVYFLDVDGLCTVLKASPRHEVLRENRLEGNFIATPALSGGRIYLRSRSRLYAVKGGG